MAVNESCWRFFYLTDSRRPPAGLKVASELSDQNPVGTLYEIIFVLNANFYKNITFSMSLCPKNMFRWQKTLTWVERFTSVPNSLNLAVCVCTYIYIYIYISRYNHHIKIVPFNQADNNETITLCSWWRGALLKSPYKHCRTNLTKYRRCHALRQY